MMFFSVNWADSWRRSLGSLCLVAACLPSSLPACNIPVFRYALERWHPDPIEIVCFPPHPDARSSKQLLRELGDKPGDEMTANVKVEFVNKSTPGSYADLWKQVTTEVAAESDYLVLRTSMSERTVNNWHGNVEKAKQASLLDSPKRQELRKRLLRGDAVVWLLLRSQDAAKNKSVQTMLQAEFRNLGKTLQLPDGIGLPGSELYADVPLVLDFSVLEIDPQDSNETYLVELLKGFHPKSFEEGDPILAPVFGRGRVLEVLPADKLDAKLVGELTTFLSGACSCKVKGLNPGFDLLMSANWDVDLFGEDGERPAADAATDETPLPTLISIPPGRKAQ